MTDEIPDLTTAELEREEETRLKQFKASGLWHAQWLECVCQLTKKSRKHLKCPRVPFEDHLQGFHNPRTGERVVTIQPYIGQSINRISGPLEEITRQSEDFARQHGFAVRISQKDSWHSPGKTILVEYRRAQQDGLTQ